jgi:alkaline phosphatase D
MTRREVLRLAAALGIAPVAAQLAACGDARDRLPQYEYDGEPGPEGLFAHGVASGDPLPDAVVLWTRVSPEGAGPLDVFWEVAPDEALADRVGAGWTATDGERDFTVKLDAAGLAPATPYFYRFRALGRTSRPGRTRTAPSGAVDRLRFGVVSCQRYTDGYYHAYRALAARPEIDAIIHLDDYIYEDGAQGPVRPHDPPRELNALEDYRRRYAQYRSDPDLQAAHATFPFVTVWDDHESANNSWRDGSSSHDPATEGPWAELRVRAPSARTRSGCRCASRPASRSIGRSAAATSPTCRCSTRASGAATGRPRDATTWRPSATPDARCSASTRRSGSPAGCAARARAGRSSASR